MGVKSVAYKGNIKQTTRATSRSAVYLCSSVRRHRSIVHTVTALPIRALRAHIGPHRAPIGPIGPKPKGAPPCPHGGVFGPFWGPQGPHESTGAFLRGTGAFLRGRGGRGRRRGGPKPAGCAFLGGTQILGPTPEKSDEKKSRDLANPDPPQGPPGLPRHFSKFQRGRSVEQFDEL